MKVTKLINNNRCEYLHIENCIRDNLLLIIKLKLSIKLRLSSSKRVCKEFQKKNIETIMK